ICLVSIAHATVTTEINTLSLHDALPIFPKAPELAVIVIPYPYVPEAVKECGENGVKAVIVISAGFRETGREGLELELQLLDIVRSEEHTSELQSREKLVCRLLLEKKNRE